MRCERGATGFIIVAEAHFLFSHAGLHDINFPVHGVVVKAYPSVVTSRDVVGTWKAK